MITPLHNHSEFSAIDGVSSPKEIAERMVEIECECCGLTDHGVVAGHLEFDKQMRGLDLKPIFGCELYHGQHFGIKKPNRDQAHLIALAMTDEGLKNLWRMNDAAAQEDHFHHVGRVDWEILEKYKEGVVITSACVASLVNKGILRDDLSDMNRYIEIFKDNFYLELSTYPGDAEFNDNDLDDPVSPAGLNKRIVEIAWERGIPLTYGDDGHYAYPEQYAAHDAYVAKNSGATIFTPIEDRKIWHPDGALCIKTEAEIREALSYLPEKAVDEALANSVAIGERADAHLPEIRRHLPVFVPSECPWIEQDKYADDEADKLFIDLVEEGMIRCYGEDPQERVINQTQYESEIFLDPEHNLFHYFLLTWDAFQFLDDPAAIFDDVEDRPIERGPGRGSSAGCIVARELGITDVDPLPYDLIFERFWNPGRAEGFPDIDSDIEKRRRGELKRYFDWRHGHDKVRSIGTVTRMKPKAVVESMWYACGLTQQESVQLKKIVEKTEDIDILGHKQIGWSRETDPGKVFYVMEDVGDEILDWVAKQPENRQEIIANALDFFETLCNRVSGYGVHASGIVISDERLDEIAPCRFAGSKDQRIPVTQFAMDAIDNLMLIKFDALGLRTLDVLSDWKAQMKECGVEIEWSQLEWEEHSEEMWELLRDGFTAGIFQIEDGMAKKLCKDIEPMSVSDLSMIGAANRPGPLRTGATKSIVKRRVGDEEIAYDDPFVEDLLNTTYGWFLYQEQVIRYFNKLGYSESDSDAVRKILGKKQPEKWAALHDGLEEWKGKSYVEMTARAGVDPENAEGIWAKLVEFGKYSFNKSHSVAYGTVGFRTLFAKYNAPAEFYMACIRNVDKNKKAAQIPAFVNEARRWGIKVHGPDIERSHLEVGVFEDDIYFGFDDIKGMSTVGAEYLIRLRDNPDVDLSSPEALYNYMEAQSKLWSKTNAALKKAGKPKQEGKSPGQQLNKGHIEKLYTAGAWERAEDYPTPMRELQEREKEMLSVILSDNTADAFAEHIDEIAECDTYAEALAPYEEDVRYTLPGVVTSVRPTTVKNGPNKGQSMGIVTIEYEGDSIDFAVFHNKWVGSKFLWNERTPGLFTINHSLNNKTGDAGYHFEKGVKF